MTQTIDIGPINIGPDRTQVRINILAPDGLIDHTVVVDHGDFGGAPGRRTIVTMDPIGSRSGATADHDSLTVRLRGDSKMANHLLPSIYKSVGEKVGRAIARDAIDLFKSEGMPLTWTGIDPQDGDVLLSAGLEPDTPQWEAAENAARDEFYRCTSQL
jgi:hypothetical protein